MVKAMLGTLPWAAVLAGVGGMTWWLLSREMGAGRWLFAALLVAHGLVHLLFLVPSPAAGAEGGQTALGWPFDLDRSWAVVRLGLDAGVVRAAALVLIAVTIGAFALAGLATAGILVPSAGWAPLVVVGSIASLGLLAIAFNPQLVLGIGLDVVLLWVVVAGTWRP